jgi:hypothetical protein
MLPPKAKRCRVCKGSKPRCSDLCDDCSAELIQRNLDTGMVPCEVCGSDWLLASPRTWVTGGLCWVCARLYNSVRREHPLDGMPISF